MEMQYAPIALSEIIALTFDSACKICCKDSQCKHLERSLHREMLLFLKKHNPKYLVL